MQTGIPNEKEVLEYFNSLSNWNRWGSEDQLGTLNYLSEDKTLQAIRGVKNGKTVSCARTISWDPSPDSQIPPVHYMVESGEGWADGNKVSNRTSQASTDYFGLIFHGHTITHMDSLAHFFWNGKAYNNQPSHLVSTSMGATIESIELAKEGIITRGVLVDIPLLKGIQWMERGTGVMPEDIIKAEEKFGFLMNAFKYGAPPHGGMAFGFDRLIMLLANSKQIRDVIAFPKTTSAMSLMDNSPSKVDDDQLDDLVLKIK